MPENPKLYVIPAVPEEKLSMATVALLTKLFSDVEYSNEEKLFFEYLFTNGVENFISGEIFVAHMIRLDFDNAPNESEKFLYQMELAYLLHCRHNAKLNRGTPQNFHMETFDLFLYDILCSFAHDNNPLWKKRDREIFNNDNNRGINFFNKLQETSFVFVSPFSNIQYVWSGNKYQAKKSSPINITVYGYDNEFSKYVKKLLEMKYNSLGISKKFGYSRFLEEVTGITRSKKTEYTLPYCRTAKIDLLIFCVVLGYNRHCFDRMIQLRDRGRVAGDNPANPDKPFNEDGDEMEILIDYLDKHSEKDFEYFKSKIFEELQPEETIDLIEIARRVWRSALSYVYHEINKLKN